MVFQVRRFSGFSTRMVSQIVRMREEAMEMEPMAKMMNRARFSMLETLREETRRMGTARTRVG